MIKKIKNFEKLKAIPKIVIYNKTKLKKKEIKKPTPVNNPENMPLKNLATISVS